MSRRFFILIYGLLALSMLAACNPRPAVTPTPSPTPSAETALTPSPTPVIETVVTADGDLVSLRPSLGLSFQVSGRVAEVLVRPGDSVKAKHILARLDKLTFENEVRDATARLEQSRYDLQKAEISAKSGAELAAAEKNVEAARLGLVNAYGNYTSTLLSSDVNAAVREAKAMADFWGSELGDAWLRLDEKPESDKRRTEYELAGARSEQAHKEWRQIQQNAANQISAGKRAVAAAQQNYLAALANYEALKLNDPLRQAELQVMLNETSLTRAQMDLTNTELTAPWDAMVAEVHIAPGSQVGGGPAVTLVDVGQLQFVTNNLSERDLGNIRLGQAAHITLKSFPDVVITGTVASISPLSGQAVGDAATFAVRIDLQRPDDLPLRPGMTGRVEIIVK